MKKFKRLFSAIKCLFFHIAGMSTTTSVTKTRNYWISRWAALFRFVSLKKTKKQTDLACLFLICAWRHCPLNLRAIAKTEETLKCSVLGCGHQHQSFLPVSEGGGIERLNFYFWQQCPGTSRHRFTNLGQCDAALTAKLCLKSWRNPDGSWPNSWAESWSPHACKL